MFVRAAPLALNAAQDYVQHLDVGKDKKYIPHKQEWIFS